MSKFEDTISVTGDGWEDLIVAIGIQAKKDFILSYRTIFRTVLCETDTPAKREQKLKSINTSIRRIEDVERFLESDWAETIFGCDPLIVLDRLNEGLEAEELKINGGECAWLTIITKSSQL